jgi:hypothetical protein
MTSDSKNLRYLPTRLHGSGGVEFGRLRVFSYTLDLGICNRSATCATVKIIGAGPASALNVGWAWLGLARGNFFFLCVSLCALSIAASLSSIAFCAIPIFNPPKFHKALALPRRTTPCYSTIFLCWLGLAFRCFFSFGVIYHHEDIGWLFCSHMVYSKCLR